MTESSRLAPPVHDSKNLRGIDSCQLLTPAQLAELTFTDPGVKDSAPLGEEGCNWDNLELGLRLEPDTIHNGLEDVYESESRFSTFEESDVDGYPAVVVDVREGLCEAIVGVADDQTLAVQFANIASEDPDQDPCGIVESVARMVIGNLPVG